MERIAQGVERLAAAVVAQNDLLQKVVYAMEVEWEIGFETDETTPKAEPVELLSRKDGETTYGGP